MRIEFQSDHRALARDRQPFQFVDGRIVVDEEGAAKLRRLANRKPYLGIVEVGPVKPAKPEKQAKPKAKAKASSSTPEPAPEPEPTIESGPAPVEPATPADDTGTGEGPASSDDQNG